ncbi:MAG: hypothetical protein HOJ57_17795 [Lentisphaerae bacterium]|nr:hypothetical protein [Lentisphaerota bacterium]
MTETTRSRAAWSTIMAAAMACGSLQASQMYYVDSRTGSDRNDGASPARAWASLARVNRAALKAGDTVRFARGARWRGTLIPVSGEEGAPITYSAFGAGEKPLLLGSAAKSRPDDWVKEGENLWATATPTWHPGTRIADLQREWWAFHREQDADISPTIEETSEGRVFIIDCRQPGSRGNYIQGWGPKIDWEKVGDAESLLLRFQAKCTVPFRLGNVRILRNGSPWTAGATSNAAELPEIGTEWGDYEIRLQIRQHVDIPRPNIYLGQVLPAGATFCFRPRELVTATCSQNASERLPVDAGNIIFDRGRACGWKRWKAEDLEAEFDYFYDGDSRRVYLYCDRNPAEKYGEIELALRRHIVSQSGKHDIVYDGLKLLYGAAHGFGGGSTVRITIRNCDLGYIGGGHQFTRENGRQVRFGNAIEFWGACRDNLVEGCRIWEVYDAALTNQGRGPESIQENITYRNNVIWNCEYSFEYWNNPETARTRNIRFINNTCIDAGVVWSHAQRPDPNGSHLMFYSNRADTEGVEVKYNVFYNSTQWGSRYSAGWKPLPDMDYNAWFIPAGELCYFFRNHIKGNDIVGYRERTGLDQNSFFGDPKLKDPANGDYCVAPDSPIRTLRPDGAPIGAESLW